MAPFKIIIFLLSHLLFTVPQYMHHVGLLLLTGDMALSRT